MDKIKANGGNNFSGECPYCNRQTHFSVKGSHRTEAARFYYYLECPCGNLTLLEVDNSNHSVILNIYPKNTPPALSDSLPAHIKSDLKEAWIDYHNQAYNSCAVMCRRIIEAIVKEKNGTGNDLYKKIDSLPDSLIPPTLKVLAHKVRTLGKDGAHIDILEIKNVSEPEAKESLEFVDMLNHYVYILPARATAALGTPLISPPPETQPQT